MPLYIKIIILAVFLRSLIYLISYAVWELKNGTKKGGAAALCLAAVTLITVFSALL